MKKILILIVLISFSGHAQLGGLAKKVKNKVEKKEVEKKDTSENENSSKTTEAKTTSVNETKPKPAKIDKSEGITSPLHEKYLNKVVFSSKEVSLAKKAEIESDFKNEFALGDPIYFRIYLSKTIEQSLDHLDNGSADFEHGTNLEFKFYVNDVLIDNVKSKFEFGDIDSDVREKWTTIKGAFKPATDSKYIGKNQFENMLRLNGEKFNVGKNMVKVEIIPLSNYTYGDVIATGEFTLNVKNSLINPNDPEVCMPLAKMKDDVLLKNIIKNHSEVKTGFKVDPKYIRIISSNWNVNKNYKGIPINRTLAISAGYKDPTSNKCYRAFYSVEQEYIGSKFSNETYLLTNNLVEKEEINCGCIK